MVDLSKPVRFKESKERFYIALGAAEGSNRLRGLSPCGASFEYVATLISDIENVPDLPKPVLCSAVLRDECVVCLETHAIKDDHSAAYFRVSRTDDGKTIVEVVKDGE